MNHPKYADPIREDQIRFGQSVSQDSAPLSKPRRIDGSNNPMVCKASPKGHEAFLKGLEGSKAQIRIEKISSGAVVCGVVKCSDEKTISLILEDGKTSVIFKHDISEFSPVEEKAH
jgi:sRNA-binding regulator protein Hfq